MKKSYVTPEISQYVTEPKCPILAGSNYLDNGTDEDAGVKVDAMGEKDDLWYEE